jgi:hypothetical protein
MKIVPGQCLEVFILSLVAIVCAIAVVEAGSGFGGESTVKNDAKRSSLQSVWLLFDVTTRAL